MASSLLPTSHILAFFNEEDAIEGNGNRIRCHGDLLDSTITTGLCRVSLQNDSNKDEMNDKKNEKLLENNIDNSIAFFPNSSTFTGGEKACSAEENWNLDNGESVNGIAKSDKDEKPPYNDVYMNGISSNSFEVDKMEGYNMNIHEKNDENSPKLVRNVSKHSDSCSISESESDSDSDSDVKEEEKEEEGGI